MKRMLMALAVAGMAAAGSGRADPGGYSPPGGPHAGFQGPPTSTEFSDQNTLMGMATAPSGRPPDRYGLLPGLRRAFRLHGSSSCSTCEKPGLHAYKSGPGGYEGYPTAPQYPPVMQGTLAFPHNPYIRSPRDFFMYEPGK